MASYVFYGFDTAGALAEETDLPRRRAPWAIVQALAAAALAGGLLILFGILSVSDPGRAELGQLAGGLPFLVKDVLGPTLGTWLLLGVVFAVFVCALAVQAAAVRLVFAMARDNNLPFAHALANVEAHTKAPIIPAIVVGIAAAGVLFVNFNLPSVIETLCSVAIVWANLAYLFVTVPQLFCRLRPTAARADAPRDALAVSCELDPLELPRAQFRGSLFSLGRWGLSINAIAVVWGIFVVVNIGWPRAEIHGADPWRRFAAPLATLLVVLAGTIYYWFFQRKRRGILAEHAAESVPERMPLSAHASAIEASWIHQLAPGE
jgi:amino acid transporter